MAIPSPFKRISFCLTLLAFVSAAFVPAKAEPALPEASAQETGFSAEGLEALGAWTRSYAEDGKLAGLITLVAKDGKIAHFQTAGVRDLETQAPMTRDTLFRIFSMTKPVTSVAIMMLVEDGKLGLDDPIADHIPAFADARVYVSGEGEAMVTEPAERAITVRDLLTHSSGLTYGIFGDHPVDKLYMEAGLYAGGRSSGELVQVLAGLPLLKQPGTGWHYSLATDVLGHLVEVVSGKTLDVFFEEEIFQPLGMTDTVFFADQADFPRLATVYQKAEEGEGIVPETDRMSAVGRDQDRWGLMSGGGGLVSTTDDYLRFCQMLLNGGTFNGVRLLEEETVARMSRNHLAEAYLPYSRQEKGFGFGLGFSVLMDEEEAGLGSEGEYAWGGAASTVFWIDPKEDIIAILMTQFVPSYAYPLREEFKAKIYEALEE